MRKQLGILASLLFLGSAVVLWTGCSNRGSYSNYGNPCYDSIYGNTRVQDGNVMPDPCPAPSQDNPCAAPCPAPRCGPCVIGEEPLCRPHGKCRYPNSNELCCVDGIIVKARNPHMCMLGDQYSLDFDVQACDDVCDVVVTAHLPEGVNLVRSEPQAKVEGRKLTWDFGSLRKGECRPARVLVECECEGELCACFCASATPVRFCS